MTATRPRVRQYTRDMPMAAPSMRPAPNDPHGGQMGSAEPPTLHSNLVEEFPVGGDWYFYRLEADMTGAQLIVSDRQSKDPARTLRSYSSGNGTFRYHADQTAKAFRVWKTPIARLDLGKTGLARGGARP